MSRKTVRGCSTPCPGWAALEGHVERKISEARSCVRVLKPSDRETAAAYLHWHGQLVALVKLRRNFKRWKEAPPNEI